MRIKTAIVLSYLAFTIPALLFSVFVLEFFLIRIFVDKSTGEAINETVRLTRHERQMLAAKMAPPPSADAPAGDAMDLPPILPTGLDLPPMPAPAEKAEPGMLEQMMDNPAFKSAMRSAGTVIGREITRSIFGTGRRRR